MIFGAIDSYNKFKELNGEEVQQQAGVIKFNTTPTNIDKDSLVDAVDKQLENIPIPIDSVQRQKILEEVKKNANDSTLVNNGGNKICHCRQN